MYIHVYIVSVLMCGWESEIMLAQLGLGATLGNRNLQTYQVLGE